MSRWRVNNHSEWEDQALCLETWGRDYGTICMCLSGGVKCKVYRTTVLATQLYGAEMWTVYRVQVKKLHANMMRHLQAIMNISWKDKITNIEVLKWAGLPSIKDMLIQMYLRWLGYVARMDHQRLPRQLLYSQLCKGKCNRSRPRIRFKDTVKRNLKKLDIERGSWQRKAKDIAVWKNLIRPKCSKQSLLPMTDRYDGDDMLPVMSSRQMKTSEENLTKYCRNLLMRWSTPNEDMITI